MNQRLVPLLHFCSKGGKFITINLPIQAVYSVNVATYDTV